MELAQGYSQVVERMAQPGIEQIVDVSTFLKTFVPNLPTNAIVDEVALLTDELATVDDAPDAMTANTLWSNGAYAQRH